MGRPRPAATPPADAGGGQATAPPGEPGPAAAGGLRGSPLDRRRDPGTARRPGREPPDRPPPAPRQLSARVPARLGQQDLLHPAPDRPAAARERRGAARTRCSGEDRTLEPLKRDPDRADRGQSLLPGGERPDPGGDPGARRASGAPTGWRGRPSDPGAGHGAGDPGRAHRPAAARGQAPAPGRRGHRQGRAVRAAAGDRRAARGRACARGSRQLQAAEFLYETSLFPDLEYTFKHALTHEVAYGSLLQERRRALHARIVEAIEALYPERLAEQIERLAHHAFRGEAWEKAVRVSPSGRREGASAARRTGRRRHASSRRCTPSSTCPESRERTEQAIDMRLELRAALFPLGEHGSDPGVHRRGRPAGQDARRPCARRLG